MRPIIKNNKLDEENNPLTYVHWSKAKPDLINEIGHFCSYCERSIPNYAAGLSVEHIFPKSLAKYEHLIYRWDNYLLACINCNSSKKNKDFDIQDTYLPHVNNLFYTLEVIEGGGLKIKEEVSEIQKRRTRNYLNLTGLDKKFPDDRFNARLRVWDIAKKVCKQYIEQETRLSSIIDIAIAYGFLSVWLKVFENYPEVKQELISQFVGTDKNCFDQDYRPLPRNGDNA